VRVLVFSMHGTKVSTQILGSDYRNNILQTVRLHSSSMCTFRAKELHGMTVFVLMKLRVLAWNCRLPIFLDYSWGVSYTWMSNSVTWRNPACCQIIMTGSTVGSLEDRNGPRDSTDEQRQAAMLAHRNAARRNIYVVKSCGKGSKAK
jgi:hypothetical protein